MKRILLYLINKLEKVVVFSLEELKPIIIESSSPSGISFFLIEILYWIKIKILPKLEKGKLVKNKKIKNIFLITGWENVINMGVSETSILSYPRILPRLKKSPETIFFVIELYAKDKDNLDKTFFILLSPLHALKYYQILSDIKEVNELVLGTYDFKNVESVSDKYRKRIQRKYSWMENDPILFSEKIQKI